MTASLVNLGERISRVKDIRQGLPARPAGVPADARHETANLVHSAAVRLLRYARAADIAVDLDGPRASLLSVLVFAGPQPVTRLAEIEQVSPPAITKMVTALEATGLVSRERSTEDRRVVRVAVTAAGRRLFERGRAARIRAIAALLERASTEELAVLHRAAEIIGERLRSRP
jgi:DNA-binding MarR family transcriptional regulator